MATSDPQHRVVDDASLTPRDRVPPTWTEPIVRRISGVIGGALGRHAQVGRKRHFTALRAILLMGVVVLALGWFAKAPCLQQTTTASGEAQLDWSGSRQYVAMCYSDTIPRYQMADLSGPGAFPYKSSFVENPGTSQEQVRYMEYPVLTGLFQWMNVQLTDGWLTLSSFGILPGGLPSVVYFDINAFWLAAAWLTTLWAVFHLCRQRPWNAAIAALSPLVAVHVFTNFDPLATMFATTALLAWTRRRPVLAGLLLGLGAATKLFPLFLLGPLFLLCVRERKLADFTRTALSTVAAWLAVNLPILLLYPRGWGEFFRLNSQRAADPDSLYNVISHFTGWAGFDGELAAGQSPTVLNVVSLILFLVCCAGIAYVALTAPYSPRLAQLSFLVVAAFLLTNKVWSPQYSLWLVPLAVLAIPRWRLLFAWMTADALVWAPRMYYYLGQDKMGLPEDWFLGAVLIRDAFVIAICVLIIVEIYRPAWDRLRQFPLSDPPTLRAGQPSPSA